MKFETIFLGEWTSIEQMANDFFWDMHGYHYKGSYEDRKKSEVKALGDANILVASYETGSYDGDAFVLFEENGKLYEVNAGHCSCYGLEGQWSPEEVDVKELYHRLTVGNFGKEGRYDYDKGVYIYDINKFNTELLEIVEKMLSEVN